MKRKRTVLAFVLTGTLIVAPADTLLLKNGQTEQAISWAAMHGNWTS